MALNRTIDTAFVSTNSITQGEQVGVLWPHLLGRGIFVTFAHRTFQWSSEARGKAAVHCVIVGMSSQPPSTHTIYEYQTVKSEPHPISVSHINPYIIDAPNAFLPNRATPITNAPAITYGSKPTDGGHLIMTAEQKLQMLAT